MWPKSEVIRLVDLIEKYQKDGVVLVSGDVHCAQLLSSKCRASSSSYKLHEITTSGLTHTCDKNIFGHCAKVLDFMSPRALQQSEAVIALNYATFEVQRGPDGDIVTTVKIKGLHGQVHEAVELSLRKDLSFRKGPRSENLVRNEYCRRHLSTDSSTLI